MPVSSISQVTFQQEWLVGDAPIFSGNVDTDIAPDIFRTEIELPAIPPLAERVRISVLPVGVPGVDGVFTFGGNFKPDMNNLTVTAGSLDASQTATVLSSISVTQGGVGEADVFEFFATPVASSGAQFFTLEIPYVEQDVDFPQTLDEFAFIDFWQDTGAPSTDNTILIVNNDTEKYIQVKAGVITTEQQSLSITNIVDAGRQLQRLDAEVTALNFVVNYEENILNQFIFIATGAPIIPDVNFYSLRHSLYYQFTCNATPTGIFVTNIQGRAAYISGANIFNNLYEVYAIYGARGLRLTMNVPSDRSEIQYGLTWSSSVIGNRRTSNLFYIGNQYDFPITVRHVIIGEGNSRLELSGRDNAGLFYNLSEQVGDKTCEEFTQTFNDMVNSVPDWQGKIIIVWVGNKEASFAPARADWLEPIDQLLEPQSAPGNNWYVYFDYNTFQFDSVQPFYNVNIPRGSRTLREALDLNQVFFDEFGFRFPFEFNRRYTQSSDPGGDDWLDSTAGMLALPTRSVTKDLGTTSGIFANDTAGTFTVRIGFTDSGQPWDTVPDVSFNYAGFTNVGSLVTAFNSYFAANGKGPAGTSITALAGLFFDSVPVDYLIPPVTEPFEDIESVVGERYEIQAGTNGRLNLPISLSRNYLLSSTTIEDIANQINADFPSVLESQALNALGNESATTLKQEAVFDLNSVGVSKTYVSQFETDQVKTYNLNSFVELDSLITTLNADWNSEQIFFERNSQVFGRIDAVPSILEQFGSDPATPETFLINDTSPTLPGSMTGFLPTIAPPDPVVETIRLEFNVAFAVGGNPNSPTGIQVALGGFQIDGVDFFNQSPNTFFEPVFNTIFDIQFNTFEADKIYLLVQTREDIEGATFSADAIDFTGLARFSNGAPSQVLTPFKSSDAQFVDPWGETQLGGEMPVLLSVDGISTRIDVGIDQTRILDSINVTLINRPESLNEFAFLARNRTNENQSMVESQNGRVFGLALDNRGAWDILIGPEAVLREVADGEFDYLSRSYDRDFIDTDEGYDFEFFNFEALPTEVQGAISLSPVAGYPQVWVLRIDPGVKRYLGAIRQGALPNSLDGCSIDIDLFARGRISDIEGICRVTVFHDYRCVFDIGLCDFFWNLTDPPEPEPPELIEDNLVFTYQNLIDCQRLDVDSDGSVNEFGLPILITIDNVPTFENGNAVLLVKTVYTAEIQGFYWPLENDLNFIQDGTCTFLNSNTSLVSRLNKPAIYLPGEPTPITDPFQILEVIENEPSYLYVQPRFQFPIQDLDKECGPEEFVLTGIGYQFKNWQNGFRTDDVLIGANLVLGGDVFAAPEIQFCYRYYYNQDEG